MGPIAARHARTVLEHVERIVAIELRVAAEAIDHRRRLLADEAGEGGPFAPAPGAGVAEAHARIRALVPPLDGDREPGPDLAAVTRIVHEGMLVDLVAGTPDAGWPT
jgi:histidine ammonia-lyase